MIELIVEKVIDDIEEEIFKRFEEGLDVVISHKFELSILPKPEEIFNQVAEDIVDELYIRLVNRNFFNDFHDIDI